jgi:4-diphosphocytidyl-2-C-methyl-D-erythritol kinase
MIVFPNCKLNLGLHILNKRPDGYHNIETVMVPIKLQDALEFLPDETDSLTITGIELGQATMKDNLVYKALQLLRQHGDIPPLKIHLHKAIPAGAGLGGGSADASFMLRALNDEFKLNLDTAELKTLAAKLGSDCPFFIENSPALAEGRGEFLSNVDIDLRNYTLVVVVPPVHISTAEAYSSVTPRNDREKLCEIISMPIETWKNVLVNDFEAALSNKFPVLQSIKETLYQKSAIYASLSGSGSSVFGIFCQTPNIATLFPDCTVFVLEPEIC